ncbi:11687_t:CDS:1 [Acaulospora colombiana]|uniref:11687_t:CDS:1 n=1 Tax=Acaulospora colombiana TaxID=27376 RepID=A0ACA9MB01_9GLOM|nr:11687_t:CDS:1 [Acaulospora colombiana]
MLLKRTLFATFVAFSLLALCLNATTTSPPASVDLKQKLGGTIEFFGSVTSLVKGSGQFTKGIDKNIPGDYFIGIKGKFKKKSFEELGIEIVEPGTSSFTLDVKAPIIGYLLTVYQNTSIIAKGRIRRIK